MKILSLSGFIPEQICDVVRFVQYEGDYKISHYCGYVSDYISQVINDTSIDGAVFPKSCDSSRVITSYLQNSGKFLYQIPVPARIDDAAVKYMAYNIEHYQKALEGHYGITITDVQERIEQINHRNQRICQLYNRLGNNVIYSTYLSEIHEMLTKPLAQQEVNDISAIIRDNKKKIYLVGSFLSNCNITKVIEKSGMVIVGDNLTESKRLFSAPPVSTKGNIYENIAKSILYNHVSPTQNQFSRILKADLAEVKAKNIGGVIYISQKYCEPYDFLYSIYKKAMDENGIPILRINVSDSRDGRHLELALGAFADIL